MVINSYLFLLFCCFDIISYPTADGDWEAFHLASYSRGVSEMSHFCYFSPLPFYDFAIDTTLDYLCFLSGLLGDRKGKGCTNITEVEKPIAIRRYSMSDFVEVSKTDGIAPGKMKPFVVDGKEVLIVNYEGHYYAIGRRCTHKQGDLSAGKLEGKIVTCPVHGSKFDVTTGISVGGPKIGLIRGKTGNEPAYEVKVEGNSIKVKV